MQIGIESAYVQSHVGCGTLTGDGLSIYKTIQMNSLVEKAGFEIKNETAGHRQSSPKSIGILKVLRCIFGPNLEILTLISCDLLHRQAQNVINFYIEVQFDLESQGQSTPKIIGILTKVFCICGPNLVILAWTDDKLSCIQARDWRPHTHIDTGDDNTRRPKLALGKNCFHISQGVKSVSNNILFNHGYGLSLDN